MSETLLPEPPGTEPRRLTRSIHAARLEQSIPPWLTEAAPSQRAALKKARAPLPDWYRKTTRAQRKAFDDSLAASFSAQSRLGKTMAGLQDIHAFAEPLLTRTLKNLFNVELDVNNTFLHLIQSVDAGIWKIEIGAFEVSRMSLLQAALHNVEEAECEPDAFHRASGFSVKSAQSGQPEAISPAMTVSQFLKTCRVLDIGALYQQYLKNFLYPQDPQTRQNHREQFITAQKTALRAAAEQALLQKDIEPEDYASILTIIAGERQPRQGSKHIWFCDLNLMRHRLTGCVWFAIGEPFKRLDELILYIPDDPQHPLKRYRADQVEPMFRQRFTARDGAVTDGSPTAYQRFFSRFVAYADRPHYFSQFTQDAPDASLKSRLEPWLLTINNLINGLSPVPNLFINHFPPAPTPRQVPNDDPFLGVSHLPFKAQSYWDDNIDLWDYLFERHREQMIEDARRYAVPSADIDAKVRKELFARLLDIGMLVLNTVSMFVPVLGEVMMAVMVCQLLGESIEGVIEWSEGDRQAAKAHLLDVAENLLLAGVTAGIGKGVSKWLAVPAEPVIEDLHSVTRADGSSRLHKADLAGYEVTGEFMADAGPDAQGRYELDDRSYIRIDGRVYEQVYDPSLDRWRVRHPVEPQAYRPILTHNAAGAWRHTLENPLGWSRLKLLRRMGHVTDACSDEQLLKVADICGVSDNALRKMHMDNRLPPPELLDALRLFEADRDVTQVIEQVVSGHAIDERYLYAVPLVTRLEHWPAGRILQVFENPRMTGVRAEYGHERLSADTPRRTPIRMSRFDVLSGELPMRILAALDESEISTLLGAEAAQNRGWRPQALRDRIGAFARSRRRGLFDGFYRSATLADPGVDKLRRVYPGLSDAAAQDILAHADAEAMAALKTTARVPGKMLEEARWHARRGRLTRALAGLHMENLPSADTRRVALHTLSRLPGWPDDLYLEIREGHLDGRLLDSIGNRTAGQHCRVVKKGPVFQAINARGEALNEPAASTDSFYAALMHALPVEARQALGVPRVTQGAMLRRAISAHATAHINDTAAILVPTGKAKRRFKPPQRIRERLLGYPASGAGMVGSSGLNMALVTRLQGLYPPLKIARANGFLLKLLRAGKSEAQILQMLEELGQQWLAFEQALDGWVSHGGNWQQKNAIANNLKNAWRRRPFVDEHPAYAQLDLVSDEPLPALSADFSHISTLHLRVPGSTDQQIRALLRNFPELEHLDLSGNRLTSDPLSPHNAARLRQLDLSDNLLYRLDVSAMHRLESLNLNRTHLQEWPRGAESLRHLSWLDLRDSRIRQLPAELLSRNELLLNTNLTGVPLTEQARLQLELAHQRCEFALGLPDGALARFFREDVSYYDTQPFENGSLLASRLLPLPPELAAVADQPSFIQRLRRIDPSLTEESAADVVRSLRNGATDAQVNARIVDWGQRFESITRQLNGWIFTRRTGSALFGGRWRSSQGRREAAMRMIEHWKKGLVEEVGGGSWVLDLSNIHGLGALPRLPAEFEHIDALNLRGLALKEADLADFLPAFTRLRWIELGLNKLRRLPRAIAGMEHLEELGLSGNRLGDLAAIAQELSRLQRLTYLRLNYNRVRAFNGEALQALPGLQRLELNYNQISLFSGPVPDGLQKLYLNGNNLRYWPDGVLQARNLEKLSLTGNPISELPPEMFDGSHDLLLAGTRMSANFRFLSKDSLLRIKAYMDRVRAHRALGITRDTLEKWLADSEWGAADAGSESSSVEDLEK
ncbi:leucine-rich repeat domain-containing protein [Pseudomonas sp. B2M1-30]|uniref:leucine-rich repeat domain-containing protein n=1 Tax=Pseudomonas TaxID=286 RepID=UPI0021CA5DC3|nr:MULTISPECIES: leucine-rich repeat domain-containing protein [Pseudomonas]MCU0117507.1 leucine-rich repeat domain-containing protein [Pseudomonas sp. B2M1-30]MCU7259043.1 leucine-rich repeat domain-containing protein [Pseudomonas koreensis]